MLVGIDVGFAINLGDKPAAGHPSQAGLRLNDDNAGRDIVKCVRQAVFDLGRFFRLFFPLSLLGFVFGGRLGFRQRR